MKEFLTAFVFVLATFVAGGASTSWIKEAKLIRDCSITGVHIIADDTVVVCKVVKVRTQEVPSPANTKPEVTL
jgi:flavin reductase (DIM6/NTAB) family NADH-FMN oxidoreductase RutF